MINSALTHRCSIRRATITNVDGSPVSTWSTVKAGVPCFVSPDETEMDPTWTATQAKAAAMSGTALFAPSTDIQPGDVIVLGRPAPGLSFSVGQAVRPVMDQQHVHHIEAQVTQTNSLQVAAA